MKYVIRWTIILITVSSIFGVPIEPDPKINVNNDVKIELYTLGNPSKPQLLVVNDKDSILESHYSREAPTRIFIHGFGDGKAYMNDFKTAYLKDAQHNLDLIAINWSKISNTIDYLSARRNARVVGQHTANFIDFMVIHNGFVRKIKNRMMKLRDLTVIGFSLGAHVAGFAGKNLQSGRLRKIIGLDPARVLYDISKPEERLNSTDAEYVETIQTSMLGFKSPIGSVSFYPNGGSNQPGCPWRGSGISCSHSTSYNYNLQTIVTNVPFYGDLCASADEMKNGKCNPKKQASMGGEPGAKKQPSGMYHIRIDPNLFEYEEFGGMADLLNPLDEGENDISLF